MELTKNFWNELPRPFFVLAPMEDVTNVVFRHVVSRGRQTGCVLYGVYEYGELLSPGRGEKCAWALDLHRR